MADIITYPENGIQYDADDASGYLATRLSGVYSADEDFAVTANGDLTVTVSAGQAWVHPARFRGRSIIMEQPETVTLTAADAVRSRIDRVVLRYDAAAKKTSLLVLTGTPDSASPAPPEISRTALVYDLSLATITRKAGSSAITAADITDTRADEDVCGVMRDGVTGIPTAELQAQALAIMTQLSTELHTKLDVLDAAIASVESGSFYTKAEADRKFGTPYTLPAATATTLGGVKVGSGLTVDSDGRLSADSALAAYPVGSIYQSADPTSPAALFGGSWEEIASDRVLMGASSAHAAGTTVEAGLPNITGSFVANVRSRSHNVSGAFTAKNLSTSTGADNSDAQVYKFSLDASNSNAIYGASSTVQPAAYYVHIWRRVA